MELMYRKLLIGHGAIVFLLGLLAGFPFAFFLAGEISLWPIPWKIDYQFPGTYRGWRMAHLEGILNGLVLFAVAAIGSIVQFTPRAQKILVWCLIITAYGNIAASIIGPLYGGEDTRGLVFGDNWANSAMYILFVAAIGTILMAIVMIIKAAFSGEDGKSVGD